MLPWWSEAIKRDLLGARSKCETCKEMNSEAQRRLLACGFLSPPDETHARFVTLWRGGSLPNHKTPETTVCPGYSTSLPEVIEVVRAHRHWSKGNLPVAHREANDPLVVALEIFDGALSEYQSWAMTSEADGGGRKAS